MGLAVAPPPTRRLGGITFVVVLHAVVVYALVTGLGRQAVEVLRAPLETKIIDELKAPPPDAPPPPPPKVAPPPTPYIPPPDVVIRTAPAPTNAITAVTTVKPVEAPPPVAKAEPAPAVHVAPVLAAANCRKPEYPPISARNEEEGTTQLLLLVDVDGHVAEGKVEQSSGHKRLDDAALSAFSLCHFPPGTVDGKPEQAWGRIKYVWKVE